MLARNHCGAITRYRAGLQWIFCGERSELASLLQVPDPEFPAVRSGNGALAIWGDGNVARKAIRLTVALLQYRNFAP